MPDIGDVAGGLPPPPRPPTPSWRYRAARPLGMPPPPPSLRVGVVSPSKGSGPGPKASVRTPCWWWKLLLPPKWRKGSSAPSPILLLPRPHSTPCLAPQAAAP
eukprot:298396-Prorocentrum_minimum.AAC.1